jgi:hypothetical protein
MSNLGTRTFGFFLVDRSLSVFIEVILSIVGLSFLPLACGLDTEPKTTAISSVVELLISYGADIISLIWC